VEEDLPLDRPPGMPSIEEMEGPPRWDQSEADWLVGKTVLVGITFQTADGTIVTSKEQYHGKIIRVDRRSGIVVACEGVRSGQSLELPPDLRAFCPAGPGEYRLRSTGEIIKDPDVLTTWTFTESLKS
jgi:hypothetical protein